MDTKNKYTLRLQSTIISYMVVLMLNLHEYSVQTCIPSRWCAQSTSNHNLNSLLKPQGNWFMPLCTFVVGTLCKCGKCWQLTLKYCSKCPRALSRNVRVVLHRALQGTSVKHLLSAFLAVYLMKVLLVIKWHSTASCTSNNENINYTIKDLTLSCLFCLLIFTAPLTNQVPPALYCPFSQKGTF